MPIGIKQKKIILQTTKIYKTTFDNVTEEHAFKEGEKDKTLKSWKSIHKEFFSKELLLKGIPFNDNFDNSENLYKQLLFLPLSKNINEKTAKNIALFLNSVIDQKPKQINDKNEIKNFDGLFLW